MRLARVGSICALALTLAAAGCGSAAAPKASPPARSSSSAPAGKAPATGAPAAGKPLSVAWVVISANQAPVWVAKQAGFFKQQGLDVKLIYIAGSVTAVAALAKGDVQMMEATPAASVEAQLKGEDTVVLGSHLPYATERLVAGPGIKTVADLRGQTIGLTKAGAVDDVVTRQVLTEEGLVPGRDVRLAYLNQVPAQVAALQKNLVQGIVLSPPYDMIAEQQGAHLLLNYLTLHIPYPADGLVTTRSFLSQHPGEVHGFLVAWLQALNYIRTNAKGTEAIISQYTHQTNSAILAATWKDLKGAIATDPVPLPQDITEILHLLHAKTKLPPSAFLDAAPMAQALKAVPQTGGTPAAS